MAISLTGVQITLPSVGVSLLPTTQQLPWSGESLLFGLSSPEAGGSISLSNTLVNVLSSVGTVVGTLSVTGGSTRPYTFTLTTNPSSYFTVGGSTLSVLNALSVGSPVITVRASDTGASTINGSFTITIFSTATGSQAMQFNITTNSMYIPLLGGLG